MKVPLIGVTTSRTLNPNGFPQIGVVEAYIKALSLAGACPLLIPSGLSGFSLDELVTRLDGVLFSGGGDVHPEHYASQPHPRVDFVDEDRDRLEIQLLQDVVRRKTPFFGICRGLQVINVALGGNLYEDLRDQRPESLEHDHGPDKPHDFLAHPVQVTEDSQLAAILGVNTIEVNSLHHQGIRELAPDLRATALAPDGLIEL